MQIKHTGSFINNIPMKKRRLKIPTEQEITELLKIKKLKTEAGSLFLLDNESFVRIYTSSMKYEDYYSFIV